MLAINLESAAGHPANMHVRGNLVKVNSAKGSPGSIPAPAWIPPGQDRSYSPCRVYPRTCGETQVVAGKIIAGKGLSPHLRGNHLPENLTGLSLGSIPAPAGKPGWGSCAILSSRVYPRTCGETTTLVSPEASVQGLSPHVRGNRARSRRGCRGAGSIPARAGEPSSET